MQNAFACDQNLPAAGTRDDVLIIVNDNSKDSCEVGRYYAEKRGLGQNNILHVSSPAAFFITWTEFKQLRDQILNNLQQRIAQENPGITLATCSGSESPSYCAAAIDQITAKTRIRYLVMTKGVPARMVVDGSTLFSSGEATVVDNYLRFWLTNYYGADVDFYTASRLRAQAFDDGRGMRPDEPSLDREMIFGRIDGVTLDAAKAMIDRTLAAEANGIFGKIYTHTNQALYNASTGMVWKNYNGGNIYSGGTDPWRYQFGLFNETLPECNDYNNPNNYLQYSYGSVSGKTPSQCTVKVSVSPLTAKFGTNDPPPATPGSRQPVADDSLIYIGHLDGQAAGGGAFSNFTNWRRNTTCSNTLCENLPLAEQAACRAASTDVYKEIDTRCVGVADGFIGYNYQSFPVSFFNVAPTGWQTGNASNFRQAFAEIRADNGADDNYSLWYRNNDEVAAPLCYSGYDFTSAPSVPCAGLMSIYVDKPVDTGSIQTSLAATPDQYRLRFKYKSENLNRTLTIQTWMAVTESVGNKLVGYARINATPSLTAGTISDWQQAEVVLSLDHADPDHTPGWNGGYRYINIYLGSSAQYSGAIALDDFSLAKITSSGDIPVNLVNPSFAGGHKATTTGDHAVNYLSRLNGVAFWGSMSHHQSAGHSFSTHPLETMIYFMRGLPLGDAVWYAEPANSGILYGDPLYSPLAVKLDYLTPSSSNKFVHATQALPLSGSAVNGNDTANITTTYTLSYCNSPDFYTCDLSHAWINTGLTGPGGQRAMSFGSWDITTLAPGAYTLRLSVTSTNVTTNRTQTYNDYQTLILYNDTSDYDHDGLTDVIEMAPNSVTSPTIADMDGDGLLDGEEVNIYHTNPRSYDTDGDGINDKIEVTNGMNPLVNDVNLDLDGDGVSNWLELANKTKPNDATSFPLFKTVYVDINNATGVEDGSTQNPFSNLDTALAAASHGDTVRIAAGDYALTKYFNKLGLHISGVAPGQTRVNLSLPLYLFSWYSGAITDLQLNSSYGGIVMYNSQNITVRNVGIDAAYQALSIYSGLNIHVTGVNIHSQDYTGIELYAGEAINIDHCLVRGDGIQFSVALSYYTDVNIGNVNVDQCTFTNFDYGIVAYDPSTTGPTLHIHNSIVDSNIDFDNNSIGVQLPEVHYSLIRNGMFANSTGNLAGSPQFVNALSGDYHLLPASPAVATGDPASALGAEPAVNARVNMGYYGGTAEATAVVDLDGDRLPDGYEATIGLDPTIANTNKDTDTDGFTDDEEFWAGTSPVNATIKPTYRSVVLNTRLTSAQVVSLVASNTLSVNGQTYALSQYVPTSIPGLVPGTLLTGTGPFSVGSSIKYTDTTTPLRLAGQLFVIPHQRNNHEIQLYSPYADANVQIVTGGAVQNLLVARATVATHRIVGSNNQSTVITTDRPIVVSHAAYTGSSTYSGDTNVVPPAATEILGIRSSNVYLGAAENGTQVTVYSSDGLQRAYTLTAGQRQSVSIGNNNNQGQGAALRIVANKPIGAIQANDGDGNEQTAFLGAAWQMTQASLPTGTQYIALACTQSADVTVSSPAGALLASGHCAPVNNNPGKVYLGRTSNRSTYPAGSVINSTAPVYMYYEDAQFNEERNLFGAY